MPTLKDAAEKADVKKKVTTGPDTHTKETTTLLDGQVYMEKSVTKNMGDYNSAKVTVGITLPINFTPEHTKNVKATIELIDKVLNDELESQIKDMMGL